MVVQIHKTIILIQNINEHKALESCTNEYKAVQMIRNDYKPVIVHKNSQLCLKTITTT